MFQRVLSVLLSASLLAGSVTSTAYAAPGEIGYAAAIEAETDENQNPEETSEADLQETPETSESTDESQITDSADDNSDESGADKETGDRDELPPADSGDVSGETDTTDSEDTTESTDVEESADTTEESEEVDEEEAEKYVTAAPFAVAPMAEGDREAAEAGEKLTLNDSQAVTVGGGG